MFEKQAARVMLRQLVRKGGLRVQYWDGTSDAFGEAHATVTLRLTSPLAVRHFLRRTPTVAFGEAYTEGWIEIAEEEQEAFFRLVEANARTPKLRLPFVHALNSRMAQRRRVQHHYDVGNGYYKLWLGEHWMYSCGRATTWEDGLDEMQRNKIEYLLSKLGLDLEPSHGKRLLDIGCGWGQLAVTAAKRYGVEVLGITLSEEQLKGARELAKREGVGNLVTFELLNYQDLRVGKHGLFDYVISVGMFEHVGKGNHGRYFAKVAEMLVEDGVSVLHTITTQREHRVNAWVRKHIFPGGELPTMAMITDGLANHGLWFVHAENLWQHYGRTLEHWRTLHQACQDQIIAHFGRALYRARDFWLQGSANGFYYGNLGLVQVVFINGKPQPGTYPLTCNHMQAESLT